VHAGQISSEPLVSIVTPCLNPGARLQRCIDSIAGQTYTRVEHIVVDGNSSDGTVGLLQQAADLTWISEPDTGQSNAINKGIRMMHGELFSWLNADDLLKPSAVELAVKVFRDSPDVGWVHGDIEYDRMGRLEVVRTPAMPSLATMARGNVVAQPGSFVARWALDRVGPLDESLNLAMDFDLWVRLLEANIDGRYIPQTMARFEIRPDTKSGSIDHADFLHEEYRVFVKAGLYAEAALTMSRWANARSRTRVLRALAEGRDADARAAAHEALASMPVFWKNRLYLRLTRLSPPLARTALRLLGRL
jgi:glycosyltransferase involved in cell wall biosynthesis